MALPKDPQTTLLLHNPRCSKSRQTLALLEERGIPFEVQLYLEDPLSTHELEDLGQRLGRPVIEWTRTQEAAFTEAGLTKDSPSIQIFGAMLAAPILMERPIVVRGDRAVIGRPPEAVLALFD